MIVKLVGGGRRKNTYCKSRGRLSFAACSTETLCVNNVWLVLRPSTTYPNGAWWSFPIVVSSMSEEGRSPSAEAVWLGVGCHLLSHALLAPWQPCTEVGQPWQLCRSRMTTVMSSACICCLLMSLAWPLQLENQNKTNALEADMIPI